MSGKSNRGIVGYFALVIALAVAAGIGLQAADLTHVTNSTGPTGYRGLVAANFNSADANDEIIGDFGVIGVWKYDSGNWTKLTDDNPEWIFAIHWGNLGDWEIIADFGAKGLWTWDGSSWSQLTTSNAEGGFAVDDDGDGKEEIQIDFGAMGLWRYDLDTNAWTQYTTQNPSGGIRCDLWVVGQEEGLWRFGSGLWNVYYLGSGAYWTQLSASLPTEDMAAADFVDTGTDPHDELLVEFSGLGTWLWDSGTWTRITASSADTMAPAKFGDNADWELIFADAGDTPWCWYGTSTWLRLSYTTMDRGFVVAYDPDAHTTGEAADETELAVDFGTMGVWQYNYSTNNVYVNEWKQITASDPVFMIPADYYNDGHQMTLVVNFGAGLGVWRYDGLFNSWHKMTDSIPDGTPSW